MSYNPQNPNGQTTSANSSPVVLASDQSTVPVTATVQDGSGNNLVTTTADPSSGSRGLIVRLAPGANTIGSVSLTPNTTGGWSINSQTALTNTKVAVKASAGSFGGYMLYNPNAAVTYIQVFDVASASVTLGATTPTYVIPLPPAAAANVEFSLGISHAAAITLTATTTATGSTAPTSSLTGFFLFK